MTQPIRRRISAPAGRSLTRERTRILQALGRTILRYLVGTVLEVALFVAVAWLILHLVGLP